MSAKVRPCVAGRRPVCVIFPSRRVDANLEYRKEEGREGTSPGLLVRGPGHARSAQRLRLPTRARVVFLASPFSGAPRDRASPTPRARLPRSADDLLFPPRACLPFSPTGPSPPSAKTPKNQPLSAGRVSARAPVGRRSLQTVAAVKDATAPARYEAVFLMKPGVEDTVRAAEVEKLRSMFENGGATEFEVTDRGVVQSGGTRSRASRTRTST